MAGLTEELVDLALNGYPALDLSTVTADEEFVCTPERMSARAARFQSQVTGRQAGWAYEVEGVKFDGFTGRVLQEVKGPKYEALFAENFGPAIRNGMVGQARRQVAAGRGMTIEWIFAEEGAANTMETLFALRGLTSIKVKHVPPL